MRPLSRLWPNGKTPLPLRGSDRVRAHGAQPGIFAGFSAGVPRCGESAG